MAVRYGTLLAPETITEDSALLSRQVHQVATYQGI
jgi:hypothetical protein